MRRQPIPATVESIERALDVHKASGAVVDFSVAHDGSRCPFIVTVLGQPGDALRLTLREASALCYGLAAGARAAATS